MISFAHPRSAPGALLVCAIVVLSTVLGPADTFAQPAGAATDLAPPLVISSVSPWVAPDGVFRVAFEPGAVVPDFAELTYSIGVRLQPSGTRSNRNVRQATQQSLTGAGSQRMLHSHQQAKLTGDPALGLVLEIPLRSRSGDDSRVLIPTAGIHPVNLELTDTAGKSLWSSTVYLNRLPERMPLDRDGHRAFSAVQLLVAMDSGPTLNPRGDFDMTTEDRAAVASRESLLVEARDLPLSVALRPNTLAGLDAQGDPADKAFLDQVHSARWRLTRQSYVLVDGASLTSADPDALAQQVVLGDSVLGQFRSGIDDTLWMLDDSIDTAAARVLRILGVRHLLTSDARLALPDDIAPAKAYNRTFGVQDVEGMTVSSYDMGLTRTLLEPGVDAGVRANRAVTTMMAEWFDAVGEGTSAFPGVSAAIVLPPGVDLEVLQKITAVLVGDGPLRLTEPPSASESADSQPLIARIRRHEISNIRDVLDRTAATNTRIAGYRSALGPDDARARTWTLVNNQAPALFIDDASRSAIWDTVNDELNRSLSNIQVPSQQTIVLTSRGGTIPLRFRNGLDSDVRLIMRTRSPRLDFPDGETREIVLAPGENRIDIPVQVQASGSAPLRISLSSPDGNLKLPATTVTVRSSSISGVGAALSVLSLVVLLLWWIRTFRHRNDRRLGAASDG